MLDRDLPLDDEPAAAAMAAEVDLAGLDRSVLAQHGIGEAASRIAVMPSVRRALLLQGVAELQLSTVSYGEERPAVAGSDEQAYALNRRVEIVYLK